MEREVFFTDPEGPAELRLAQKQARGGLFTTQEDRALLKRWADIKKDTSLAPPHQRALVKEALLEAVRSGYQIRWLINGAPLEHPSKELPVELYCWVFDHLLSAGLANDANPFVRMGFLSCAVGAGKSQDTHQRAMGQFKELLALGLWDLNLREYDSGATQLHWAVQNKHSVEVIAALIEAGARWDIKNNAGRTPMDSAQSLLLDDLVPLMERQLLSDLLHGALPKADKAEGGEPAKSKARGRI